MARGRTPDSALAQEAKGNPGRRKRAKRRTAEQRAAALAAATTPGDSFGPPDFMGEAEFTGAIAVWRELSPELRRIGLLERLDRYSFAMYAVHMADWIAATKDIAANGTHYDAKNINGDEIMRINPAVKVRELSEKHVLELGERFGLNPQTRFKLLRDQSLIQLGAGLFDRAETPAAPAAPEDVDPVGMLKRLAGSAPVH